jgi:hypothetical protein
MNGKTQNIIDMYLSRKYKPFYIDNIMYGRTFTRIMKRNLKNIKSDPGDEIYKNDFDMKWNIQGVNYLSKKDLESIAYSIIWWVNLEGGGTRLTNHADSVRERFTKDALKWYKKHSKIKKIKEYPFEVYLMDAICRLALFALKQKELMIRKKLIA